MKGSTRKERWGVTAEKGSTDTRGFSKVPQASCQHRAKLFKAFAFIASGRGPEPSGASRAQAGQGAQGGEGCRPHTLTVAARRQTPIECPVPGPHHSWDPLHLSPADDSRRFRKRHVRHPPRPAPPPPLVCELNFKNLGPERATGGGARAPPAGEENTNEESVISAKENQPQRRE